MAVLLISEKQRNEINLDQNDFIGDALLQLFRLIESVNN